MGTEGSDRTTKCLLVVVVVIVALLAIVAIVIAAISLGGSQKPEVNVNYPNNGQGGGNTGGGASGNTGGNTGGGSGGNIVVNVNKDGISQEDKIWMIAVGHDWGAQEYIDVDGYIRGIQMDIITEVCELAGLQCRTVWEPYNNCYDSEAGKHAYGGKGLMGGWYDACCGWVHTVGRMEIFDFSQPFLKDESNFFYVKKGNTFDLKNAKLVGFLDGWSSDEKCVARMGRDGVPLKAAQVKHYDTTNLLIDAILNGTVDAGFAPTGALSDSGLEHYGDGFYCSQGGSSMMTRKDNLFNAAWNKGWQAFKNNGGYKKVCDAAKDLHGSGRKLQPCYT